MQTQVKILGTSHISKESSREIKKAFDEFQPDVVAVELDKQRLQSLLERKKGVKQKVPLSLIRKIGATGYLFLLIGGYVQKKLGKIVNVQPGVDMLTAVKLAKDNKKPLLLVDRDVMITMKSLQRNFVFKEKMRLVWDIITAPFQKNKLQIDLQKVPPKKIIKLLVGHLKKYYPGIYKALLTERNVHMCVQLDLYARTHPGKKILLVIGAAHEDDLSVRLARAEIVRLA